MELTKRYKDLNETLAYLKIQIIDSLPYARMNCPQFDHPEDMFKWLKSRVQYENDPRGVELLQTMQTLFRNNGKGDCDCFVITTIACSIVNNWDGINIALVGRKKSHPVHIYTVFKAKELREVFDLTNSRYNYERDNYKYIQEIPVNWRKWLKGK